MGGLEKATDTLERRRSDSESLSHWATAFRTALNKEWGKTKRLQD